MITAKVVTVRAIQTYSGSRCIYPLILTLVITSRWLVNFTPRPLYPQEWTTVIISKRLDGPQGSSGWSREKRNLLLLTGLEPRTDYAILVLSLNTVVNIPPAAALKTLFLSIQHRAGLCHDSHCGGPCSIPGQFMQVYGEQWHWNRFVTEYFDSTGFHSPTKSLYSFTYHSSWSKRQRPAVDHSHHLHRRRNIQPLPVWASWWTTHQNLTIPSTGPWL